MATETKYTCDGCGAPIPAAQKNTLVPDTRPVVMTTITIDEQRDPGYYGDRKEYELCNECAAGLARGIKLAVAKRRSDSRMRKAS